MSRLRPMLAAQAPEDLDKLRFPLIASPKLDGLRCLIVDGVAVSRTLKPIRNRHIQSLLGRPEFNGLDGELIVGSPTAPNCMQASTSGVMSADGEPDFRFFLFDSWQRDRMPYWQWHTCNSLIYLPSFIHAHVQYKIHNVPMLEDLESSVLSDGYEGLILRSPDSPYKFNRSTEREAYMLKLKRFVDSEARVVGYEERMHNANEATRDERGFTKRSSHQDNKIPTGMLGALVCEKDGLTFNVGTGFDDTQRLLLWAERDTLPGRIVKYKSFPVGVKDRPRHPVFLGFRDNDDL